MKKLESTLPNMAIVLTIISVLAGGILAYVNSVTMGPIAEIKAQELSDGIKAVLNADQVTVEEPKTLESGEIIYATDKGTAVQASTNGFGGTLKVLVGFDADGNIQGYRVLEHSETPGVGAKAGDWFQATGKGNIIGMNPGQGELTVSKDGGQVDAITASTITSRAFLKAVNNAYAAFKGEAVDGASGATAQAPKAEEETAPADTTVVNE